MDGRTDGWMDIADTFYEAIEDDLHEWQIKAKSAANDMKDWQSNNVWTIWVATGMNPVVRWIFHVKLSYLTILWRRGCHQMVSMNEDKLEKWFVLPEVVSRGQLWRHPSSPTGKRSHPTVYDDDKSITNKHAIKSFQEKNIFFIYSILLSKSKLIIQSSLNDWSMSNDLLKDQLISATCMFSNHVMSIHGQGHLWFLYRRSSSPDVYTVKFMPGVSIHCQRHLWCSHIRSRSHVMSLYMVKVTIKCHIPGFGGR